MKGIIFNALEEFICENWGDDKYEKILSLCPLVTKEPFVGPGTYPDADLTTIATKAADILGVPLDDALRAFGRFTFGKLVAKFPSFMESSSSARDFLLIVNSVIHVEVKKLYPGAVTPEFTYEDLSESQLIMVYHSNRKLCSLMEGLIDGVGEHFNTAIHQQQTQCMHHGDDVCKFDLRFEPCK